MTRREYICYIFGYLSLITLIFSVSSVLFSSIAGTVNDLSSRIPVIFYNEYLPKTSSAVRFIGIAISSAVLSHILVTTGYGLYYLVEKIYEKKSIIKPKPKSDHPRIS